MRVFCNKSLNNEVYYVVMLIVFLLYFKGSAV